MDIEDPVTPARQRASEDPAGREAGWGEQSSAGAAHAPDPRIVLETLPHGVFVLDSEGIVRDANSRLCGMTGFAPAELIGAGPEHPFWPDDEEERHRAGLGAGSRGPEEAQS